MAGSINFTVNPTQAIGMLLVSFIHQLNDIQTKQNNYHELVKLPVTELRSDNTYQVTVKLIMRRISKHLALWQRKCQKL